MVSGETEDQRRTVACALELGINHFDTSSAYGLGASEVNLGRALGKRLQDVVITTKMHITPESLIANSIQTAVRRTLEGSLLRLRRESVDILMLHNPIYAERKFFPPHWPRAIAPGVSIEDLIGEAGIVQEVRKLQNEGKVRYFGIAASNSTPPEITKLLISTKVISIFNQVFNLMNPSAAFPIARKSPSVQYCESTPAYQDFKNVIPYASANGVSAQVIVPLGAGVLIDAVHQDAPAGTLPSAHAARFPGDGEYQKQIAIARRFYEIAHRHGMSLQELAYRFILSNSAVTTVVGGFSNTQHVKDGVHFANEGSIYASIIDELCGVWGAAAETEGSSLLR